MGRIINLLVFCSVAFSNATERRGKQVFYVVEQPSAHRPKYPSATATPTLSFLPYSNLYPFLSLWNAPTLQHQRVQAPRAQTPAPAPHLPPGETPFVLPFATVAEAYDNIWNYELQPKIHSVHASFKGFQRGQVESPSIPNGFTRGHVESIIQQQHPQGFIRGAVESVANYDRLAYSEYERDAVDSPPAPSPEPFRVVCYLASWSYYRKGKGSFSPENVDPSLCTHVVYAFANLDKSRFAIKEGDPQLDKEKGFYRRVVALKARNPRLKVLLGLGGWSDSGDDKYSLLANDPSRRRAFAKETLAFLQQRSFDGLSLDWHYPKCWQSQCNLGPDSDKEAFSLLVQELKSTFGPAGLLLSATLSGYKEVVELAYDLPSLSQHLDLLLVMTYDYHGAWESKSGHLAPLFMGPPSFDPYPVYNVNYTMNYYLEKGADRSKLVVGVPMYGQSFTLSNEGDSSYGSEAIGPGDPGEYTNQPGMLAYYEICKRVKENGWSMKNDRTGSWGPYAYKGDQWVGYDDPDFLTRKARYVKQQRLGGMFVWTMDLDDFNNECCGGAQPLLRTVSKELLGIEWEHQAGDCRPPTVAPPPGAVVTTTEGQVPTGTTDASSTWWPITSPTPTLSPIASSSPITSPTTTPTPSSNLSSTTAAPVVFICQQVNGSALQNSSWGSSSSSPPPPAPIPQEVEEGGGGGGGGGGVVEGGCDHTWLYKPHPHDCTTYYQCTEDGKSVSKNCPKGLHWNQYAHACDWPEYANCMGSTPTTLSTTTQTPAPTVPTSTYPPAPQQQITTVRPPSTGNRCTSGDFFPGPSCDRYYVCVSGSRTLQSCGPGLHWNRDKKLCDWPASANCMASSDDSVTIKPVRRPKVCGHGDYYGSDEDCAVYFVCNHGTPLEFRCQDGLYWNQKSKICDWPRNVDCSQEQGPTAPTTARPIYTDATTPRPTTTTTKRITTTTTTAVTTEESPSSGTAITSLRPTRPSTTSPPSSSSSNEFKIVCYFSNWAFYRPGPGKYMPKDIDPTLCTHIVYGFAVLDYTELLLKPHDTWADYDNHFYEEVTAFKKRGTKVTVALGGWNDSAGDKYSRLVNSPDARKKFITNAIEFIKKNNFDGLDLDWEYPKCWQTECDKGPSSDKPAFATFVRELKEAFTPHGLLLSAAVSPSKVVIDQGYDVPTLSRYLDWIAVMTYDYHGQWDKKTGHVAPLYFHEDDDFAYFNTNYSINYWMEKGAQRKKLVLGMPLYGQTFTLANVNEHGLNAPSSGGGTAGEYTRASGFLSYYEICSRVGGGGWTVVQDETGAMGPYAYKGDQWVSYDDVKMIRKKSELIKEMGLGGGMVWALDLDDFKNVCGMGPYPLLKTIKGVLGTPRLAEEEDGMDNSESTTDMVVVIPGSTSTPRTTTTKRPKTTAPTTTSPTSKRTTTPTTKPPFVGTVETEDAVIVGEQKLVGKPRPQEITSITAPPSPTPPQEEELGGNEIGPVREECGGGGDQFKPHESDCNKYYQCVFGQYYEYSCPPGTYWNRDHCDWVCGSGSEGGSRPTPTTKKPKPFPPQTPTTSPPWASSSTQSTSWTDWTSSTAKPPSTSTSWEWKPPIITTTTIHPIPVPDTEYKVVCYFTNWAWYRQGIGKYKPEDIDYNLCTHIAYGFAVLNPSTLEIRTHDSWADVDNSFYKLVTDLKSKGKKVVIAIGGWNDSLGDKYSKLVRDAGARAKFIRTVIAFIQKYNFDGLDLDWEYPKCWQTDCKLGPEEDKANFATFVRELKEAFTPHKYLLSAAVSPSKTIIDEGYDVPTLSRDLDWIAVMTYDYHGQWDKKTGHVAPLYHHEESDNFYFNSNYTIHYWIEKGADRKKLVMGLPMYGQSFTLSQPSTQHGLNAPSSGGGTAGEYTRASGFLAYYEICKNVREKGWRVEEDESGAIGPYAYKGDQWVSFDDVRMIRKKSEYIKELGLGGGMIWALDLDDFRNVCGCESHPLLKTINRVLRDYPGDNPGCSLNST